MEMEGIRTAELELKPPRKERPVFLVARLVGNIFLS